jgi:hypothetical protein
MLTFCLLFPLCYLYSAQLFFHKAVQNDTLFLSIVNVVDYSILVGFDENTHEVVVGIIDYMRQVRSRCVLFYSVEIVRVAFAAWVLGG